MRSHPSSPQDVLARMTRTRCGPSLIQPLRDAAEGRGDPDAIEAVSRFLVRHFRAVDVEPEETIRLAEEIRRLAASLRRHTPAGRGRCRLTAGIDSSAAAAGGHKASRRGLVKAAGPPI